MKDQYKDGYEPKEEYHPASTKGTAAFLIGVACALFGDTCLYFRFAPGVLVFFVALLICVVWIVKERQRQDREHYKQYKKMREWAYGKDEEPEEKDVDLKIDYSLDGEKFKKGGVRPGSRPSEEYKKRIEKRDAGKKD